VSHDFMSLASSFLNCKLSSISFKYLGLPVGANPCRLCTWEPLIDSLRKRLNAWGNKFVSLGGRIVLLNAVLNAIPIFLSFLPQNSYSCLEKSSSNSTGLPVGW
jgi:hypothetical protein